jgi:hyperosmotically inducible periplasmic protein
MSGTRVFRMVPVFVVLASLTLAAHGAPVQKSADESLKDRIDFGLETSSIVRKYDIKVKVAGGQAILSGDVATDAQKAEAGRLAKVAGAKVVQNTIVVDPDEDKSVTDRVKAGMNKAGEKITDGWIHTKVNWFFLGDDLLKGSDINVDVKDNVVTLKGTVKTAAGRTRAVALASDTEGVKRVIDQLIVAG